MFNLILRTTGPALVLISGLVSCAPDKTQKDVFQAPPPRIIRAGDALDLKSWDRNGNKNLDIRDILDASDANPAGIDVTSRCRGGKRDYLHTTQLSAQRLSLFQLLPAEVLAADLRVTPVTCGFEIVLRNRAGSKHVFNMGFAQIQDGRESGVTIARNGHSPIQRRERLTASGLDGFRVRADQVKEGEVHVLCEDFRTVEIPYRSSAALEELDYTRMQVHPGKPANAAELRPLQLCRAVITENRIPLAIGEIFQLQLPVAPLQFKAINLPYRTPSAVTPIARSFLSGQGAPVGEFSIGNVSQANRWVKIPKSGLPVRMTLISNKEILASGVRPYAFIARPANTVKEEKDHWVVAIPGKGSAELSVALLVPPIYSKHSPYPSWNLAAVVLDFHTVPILELSEYGSPAGEIQLHFGPRMYLVVHASAIIGALPAQIPDKPLLGL